MTVSKLKRFAELHAFSNVFQPSFRQLAERDFHLNGRWREHFGNRGPIIAELGCGKGEYSISLARARPHSNFIGIDIKGARMWVGARQALEERLMNVAFIRAYIERLERIFSENELNEIWLGFPDPHPPQGKARKRLTSPRFMEMYRRALEPGGVVHLKTDNAGLYAYTLRTIKHCNAKLLAGTEDLYGESPPVPYVHPVESSIRTFYENLFLARGRRICYLKFCF